MAITVNERLAEIEKELAEATAAGYNARLQLERRREEWRDTRRLLEAHDMVAQHRILELQQEREKLKATKEQACELAKALSMGGGAKLAEPAPVVGAPQLLQAPAYAPAYPVPGPPAGPPEGSISGSAVQEALKALPLQPARNGAPEREHEGVPER